MEQLTLLTDRLDDGAFATALESDPFGALREAGLDEFARDVERERDRIAKLIDRIYRDEAFRRAVEEDPSGKLGDAGIPGIAFEPLLLAAGAPAEVLERVSADVEAHLSLKKPATTAALAAVLGALAFAGEVAAANPAATTQVSPAATAQVIPATSAQVNPATSTQVTPAFTAQIRHAGLHPWHVTGQRAQVQRSVMSVLRAYTR